MSLIFDALKKDGAAAALSVSASPSLQAGQPAAASPSAASPSHRPALAVPMGFAVLIGMALAGAGAGLYWAGRSSQTEPRAQPPVAAAPLATPAPAAAPPQAAESVAAAVRPPPPPPTATVAQAAPVLPAAPVAAVAVMSARPLPAVSRQLASEPAPPPAVPARAQTAALSAAPATAPPAAPAAVSAKAAPVAQAEPEAKPAPRPPINTVVHVSTEAQSFDVREAFGAFLGHVQMAQLGQAQTVADQISAAMGASHVVSLRAQGYLALKKNEPEQAKLHYSRLHQALPDDREAGLNLALIEWRLGDRESAAKRTARLIEKFPSDPEIRSLHLNLRNP